MIRRIGGEFADGREDFVTGWGLSASLRFATQSNRDSVYISAAGGRGLGQYIFGISNAAAFTSATGSLKALDNVGGYAALEHVWFVTESKQSLTSSIVYGVCHGESTNTIGALTNNTIHQAIGNLLWRNAQSAAYGLEYHYGLREVKDGRSGDDHRIMFVVQIGTGGQAQDGLTSKSAALKRL